MHAGVRAVSARQNKEKEMSSGMLEDTAAAAAVSEALSVQYHLPGR
jgi:hypothetical protein